jgi:hypothetical protein
LCNAIAYRVRLTDTGFGGAFVPASKVDAILKQKEPERELYLAAPVSIYEPFLRLELIQIVIREQNLKLILYNPEQEVMPGPASSLFA